MRIHDVQPRIVRKPTKRVGRGGKRGTYSGGGEKGQRKRSGHRIRPAERDIVSKFPKLRGVKNKSRRGHIAVFNVGDLEKLTKRIGGTALSEAVLREKHELRVASSGVKILGNGEIKIAVTVTGIPVSREARQKIVKAGGNVK
jgi:large subunit ribosomal protein L15